jgi:hypothetical protein
VTGCSTGEEAYTLAMVFTEALKQIKSASNISLQIYATDLDKDAIDKARQGFFSGEHRRRRVARAARPVFRQGGERLPREQGDPGDGGLCAAESDHGSAVHQAGYFVLPEPADLSDPGIAEERFSRFFTTA